VAFDAGIISPQFYTTLVLAAVLTSQAAGAWLDYVLRRGWPLLTPAAAGQPALVLAEGKAIDCLNDSRESTFGVHEAMQRSRVGK
jgi:hypothetical protein